MGTVTFKDVPILGSIFRAVVFVNIVVIPKGKDEAPRVDFSYYKCYRGSNERLYSEN